MGETALDLANSTKRDLEIIKALSCVYNMDEEEKITGMISQVPEKGIIVSQVNTFLSIEKICIKGEL